MSYRYRIKIENNNIEASLVSGARVSYHQSRAMLSSYSAVARHSLLRTQLFALHYSTWLSDDPWEYDS